MRSIQNGECCCCSLQATNHALSLSFCVFSLCGHVVVQKSCSSFSSITSRYCPLPFTGSAWSVTTTAAVGGDDDVDACPCAPLAPCTDPLFFLRAPSTQKVEPAKGSRSRKKEGDSSFFSLLSFFLWTGAAHRHLGDSSSSSSRSLECVHRLQSSLLSTVCAGRRRVLLCSGACVCDARIASLACLPALTVALVAVQPVLLQCASTFLWLLALVMVCARWLTHSLSAVHPYPMTPSTMAAVVHSQTQSAYSSVILWSPSSPFLASTHAFVDAGKKPLVSCVWRFQFFSLSSLISFFSIASQW